MAPVTATSTGVQRQTIDDLELVGLLDRLRAFDTVSDKVSLWEDDDYDIDDDDCEKKSEDDGSGTDAGSSRAQQQQEQEQAQEQPPVNIEGLVNELEKWPQWRFQEQADLYEWIRPLNVMDAALSYLVQTNPGLLLIAPVKKTKRRETKDGNSRSSRSCYQAESASEANSIPSSIIRSLCSILSFLSNLLRNATNKSVFNSVDILGDLLAASNDKVASLALETLSSLSCPPMLHRQQAPEMQQHSTALHSVPPSSVVHARLMALARGWGSKGSGLGLAACVTADDSVSGQGSLPRHAGELNFDFFAPLSTNSTSSYISATAASSTSSTIAPASNSHSSRLVNIYLSAEDMLHQPNGQVEKRRRMDSPRHNLNNSTFPPSSKLTKSTAELFFSCIEKAGGRTRIPPSKAFLLLSQIRLAKSFHSNRQRVAAVERRLRALICILHSHPSQDILAGYLHAQPELCVELVDLIRPTVSPCAVSSSLNRVDLQKGALKRGGVGVGDQEDDGGNHVGNFIASASAIAAVADCTVIPYNVRTLAVEALTALVARRDGAGGGLTNVARQANVLGELGVGKGQFLGLLPTLIRYSLASLNAFLSQGTVATNSKASNYRGDSSCSDMKVDEDNGLDLDLDLGLAFLEATKPPSVKKHVQEELAFEFIDAVLTLTSAVVSVPSGTAALTDCGLIPALVSTVALNSHAAQIGMTGTKIDGEKRGDSYADCLLKFITAQAIQILEGAIVTHNNALSAFHDLQGVDLLVTRLYVEVEQVRKDGGYGPFPTASEYDAKTKESSDDATENMAIDNERLVGDDVKMEDIEDNYQSSKSLQSTSKRPLKAARRVLLFSIVNCLTVVFHQQDSSSSQSSPSGGTHLRKPELTNALIDIMENVDSYGGVMAALTATLLSDVMNADPQVVHHVHKSGLADSFLCMLIGTKNKKSNDVGKRLEWREPSLPQSSELIMALPNVISALSLTEDGAKRLKEADPFPDLLAIFCSPRFAMPQTRCLLNEMAAIIGTGLDEIMRHVPSLKPLVMRAIVRSMKQIIELGTDLVEKEMEFIDTKNPDNNSVEEDTCNYEQISKEMEDSRTCLMQYAYNLGQMLEQVLHNEDHCAPFVDAGGIEAILEIYPLLMPNGRQFLSHISCQSSPSLANLTHSTIASSFMVAIKSIASHYEAHKIMKKVTDFLKKHLKGLVIGQQKLRKSSCAMSTLLDLQNGFCNEVNTTGVLAGIPTVALHLLEETQTNISVIKSLSCLLRDVVCIEWLTNVLSAVFRVACQRSHDMVTGLGRSEREWQKEISSKSFENLFKRLSTLYISSMYEVCRIRTEDGFEARDYERWKAPVESNYKQPATYKLRIVCAEGAVVRNGIEIDSCASVGGLEMGEVVEAYDRCINASGIMRYRTNRGWVSEQTRGHGKEPIAEVLSIRGVGKSNKSSKRDASKRMECGVPDLRSVSASIFARLQSSHASLCSCLSRTVAYGVRLLSLSALPTSTYVANLLRMISKSLRLNFDSVLSDTSLSKLGTCMYLGNMLSTLHSCLFEDKRERQILNVPLLVHIMASYGFLNGIYSLDSEVAKTDTEELQLPTIGFLSGIRFVMKHGLADIARITENNILNLENQKSVAAGKSMQRMSKSVAACIPPAVLLLQRLTSRSLLVDSPMSSLLSRMKGDDFKKLMNIDSSPLEGKEDVGTMVFNSVRFGRMLHHNVALIVKEFWTNPHLILTPAHVINPILTLVGDVISCLEDSTKEKDSNDRGPNANSSRSGSSDGEGNVTDGDASNLQRRVSRNLSTMNSFLGASQPRDSNRASEDATNNLDARSRDVPPPPPPPPPPFEASEETVNQLMEMGFSRDHALEAIETSESNNLEIAMEYVLAHPPPSPNSIERRRAARELRRNEVQRSEVQRSEVRRSELAVLQELTAEVDSGEAISTTNEGIDQTASDAIPSQSMDIDSADSIVESQSNSCQTAKDTKDVDEEVKEMTAEEKKAQEEKDAELRSLAPLKDCLQSLRNDMIMYALNIIEGRKDLSKNNDIEPMELVIDESADKHNQSLEKTTGTDDYEAESVTVVICSFLLDLCEKYPTKRSVMVSELLRRLKSYLELDGKGSNCRVIAGKEDKFAALCHSSVIFLRALPRTRPIALKFNLASCLVQCLRNFVSKLRGPANMREIIWPPWLAPALLLLDVMAQPTAMQLEGTEKELDDATSDCVNSTVGRRGEYSRVCSEHKRQNIALSKTAKRIFIAVSDKSNGNKKKKSKDRDGKRTGSVTNNTDDAKFITCERKKTSDEGAINSAADKSEPVSTFTNFPTFLPLITQDTADSCLSICLQLLRNQQKRNEPSEDKRESVAYISPPVAHASLLLLTRVLRSHKNANNCLKMGGAETLLSLKSKSRFPGHAGLVTVALRRMLEDETTLQAAMETEIRSTVTKLHKRQSRGSENGRPRVNSRTFVQAVAPLICRDPFVFLKAAATSVRVESPATEGANKQVRFILLSTEERSKNIRALSECFSNSSINQGNNNQNIASGSKHTHKTGSQNNSSQKRNKQQNKAKPTQSAKHQQKSKSPHKSTATKRGTSPKKTSKKDRQEHIKKKGINLHGSPANHITSLLLTDMLQAMEEGAANAAEENVGFLSVVDYLEIIADLVLAVPACAAAIHRYHPAVGKEEKATNLQHALTSCPAPPNNAVSYLLHKFLPQPRMNPSKIDELELHLQEKDGDQTIELRNKREAYKKIKISQSTARLLVVLVARAGEGRRRVISDLSLALNGGGGENISGKTLQSNYHRNEDHEMWALQAWGELCIGLAAPRSSGVNQDSNSSLSFEVVKVMLEFGMAHALLHAIRRIKLEHPLAATAAAALLRPLEVFTRSTVIDTVQEMVEKELEQVSKGSKGGDGDSAGNASKGGAKKCTSNARRITLGPSQQNENAFSDDAMLEDGFDADTALRNARRNARRNYEQLVDGMVEVNDEDEFEEAYVEDDEEIADAEDFSDDESNENGSMSEDEEDDSSDEDLDDSEDDDEVSVSDEEIESDANSNTSNESDSDEDSSEDGSDSDDDPGEDGDDIEIREIRDDESLDWGGEEDGDDFFESHEEVEDEAEEVTNPMVNAVEGEIDADWTRIEPGNINGISGIILNGHPISAHGRGARQPGRSGLMIEAAEAMIGNILRAGDIQMEALAEIEDTLGIRIINQRGDLEQRGSRGGSGGDTSGRNGNRNNHSTDENLSRHNRGPVGAIPLIHQNNPPDNGFSSSVGSAGRSGDLNSMESVFGGPAVGAGRVYYDLTASSFSNEQQNPGETIFTPMSVDLQLFPGGPAASTHSRTQQSPHPLLSGVNLPPFNALMSIPRGHSNNTGRDGRSDSTDSSWDNVLASSQGNIIRLNRNSTNQIHDRTGSSGIGAGVVSWTDDGQPLDNSATEFSLAFEEALGQTISYDSSIQPASQGTSSSGSNDTNQNVESSNTEIQPAESPEEVTEDSSDRNVQNISSGNTSTVPVGSSGAELRDGSVEETDRSLPQQQISMPSREASNDANTANDEAAAPRLSTNNNLTGENVDTGTEQDMQTSSPSSRDEDNMELSEQETETNNASLPEAVRENSAGEEPPNNTENSAVNNDQITNEVNSNGLSCPPGMDYDVFISLPFEMQQEIIEQQASAASVAAQLDSMSGLDPEALAALPEDMRREVIEQEQQERRMREQEQAPADPSNAEEMDNASFVASLAPDLREEILLTADDAFLSSLPPDIIAEAQLLSERASSRHRRSHEEAPAPSQPGSTGTEQNGRRAGSPTVDNTTTVTNNVSGRKRNKIGKIRADCERSAIIYTTPFIEKEFGSLMTSVSMKALVRLMYLLSPVRPQRLLQKLFQNLCSNPDIRRAFLVTFVSLLNDEPKNAVAGIKLLDKVGDEEMPSETVATMVIDCDFPPLSMIGTAPDVVETDSTSSGLGFFRKKYASSAAAAIAANLPVSARGSTTGEFLPPVVARRILGTISFLSKNSGRVALDVLSNFDDAEAEKVRSEVDSKCFDKLLGLLAKPLYSQSSSNLEDLLIMIESLCVPLSVLPPDSEREGEVTKKELEAAAAAGKEWIDVPRIIVSQQRLHSLCSILRLESCKDSSFLKVNTIARRLCKVEANRNCILRELASVAQGLGADAIRDLRSLSIRLNDAVKLHQEQLHASQIGPKKSAIGTNGEAQNSNRSNTILNGTPSSAVTLSTSSSELKLLRVLQTLHALCGESQNDNTSRKNESSIIISQELVSLLQSINLESLWEQLTSCLRVVSVLEGVANLDETDEKKLEIGSSVEDDMDTNDENMSGGKKLQNSVAGLLTRFLPTIEAFFVVNASATGDLSLAKSNSESNVSDTSEERKHESQSFIKSSEGTDDVCALEGGKRLIEFVATNKVLLNALLRSNPSLLEKGLRAMVQVPKCRPFLDFDVKRQWFKTQVRRLRQHASRRHGSLRLNIRRQHVFEDAFHQLRLRNADEIRGRLHITFRNEEGVDAGGLSREFFGILAKEMFNPNYALFTSTEDGCTFQPNQHSNINPDHLSYFRFVGRIVGKAVVDGFLLDAHFTRSLYKHMLGVKPTHHDMQAIDPDYYKNLKLILEYNLDDIGLDLTFSTEVHSFGRSQTIDLIPNGRKIKVTEENKEKYVSLACQNRMTTAIEKQIKAYLDGFHELVKPDLISIFTAKELELLISGMPDIDIHDLKKNTDYHGYKATDKEIGWFWNIMFSLSRSEKAAFLQFATGSSKVPLAGFAELQGMRGIQKFSIHKAGGSNGALMSAHTCFNALDLPVYKNEDEMKDKLLYAIQEGGGGFLFA